MDRPIHNEMPFDLPQAGENPFALFEIWFKAAVEADPNNAAVMTLSTAEQDRPSARMVLLKEHSPDGFVFYTNYLSRKGRELETNPLAALTFWWASHEQPSFATRSEAGAKRRQRSGNATADRQVRIEGRIEKNSAEAADAYFAIRPRDSQLAAWASAQSSEIDEPVTLDEARAKFKEEDIPRPCSWGGLRLIPKRFEFWQGRTSRLHDRIVFEKSDSNWNLFRLAP